MKHFVVYKITNLINQKIYIGVKTYKFPFEFKHYWGSGIGIQRAVKKYGVKNFIKEILFEFSNSEEMYKKEAELVNIDFVKRKDTYNVGLGGKGFDTTGTAIVIDKNENIFRISIDDPRYLSGEFVSILKNRISVIDKDGNKFKVKKDDPRYLSGELFLKPPKIKTLEEKEELRRKKIENISKDKLGKPQPWKKGIPRSEECKRKMREFYERKRQERLSEYIERNVKYQRYFEIDTVLSEKKIRRKKQHNKYQLPITL